MKTKKGTIPSFIKAFPDAYTYKNDKLFANDLRIIPTEDREAFLREIIYGKKSEYPFGRDSLFNILKNEVMNVSKRDIEAFLNAQGPLVHRRSRPPIQKREHLRLSAKDFVKLFGPRGLEYMGHRGSKGYQQDRYFLNAVDLLTGYLITEVLQGKTPERVAPKLKAMIERYEVALKQKVRRIEVDKGGEFMGVVLEMLDKKKIRVIQKQTNAVVEQVNAKMQRIFWNLVEQRRGAFIPTAKQAYI